MTLRLKDVTICAADCVTTWLAARALCRSTALCEFGDAILFCDEPIDHNDFRCVRIAPLRSRAEYSQFVLQQLCHYIETPFALVVQWDGYVLEPSAWSTEFLRYDYIGARWPWHTDGMTVGNGGFSLRSRKLLEITGGPSFPVHPQINEDDQICRVQRPRLIREFAINFAPEAIADRFSYERGLPDGPSFGFHGLFNLWRHVEDDELAAMIREFPPHIVRSAEFMQLLLVELQLRKFSVLAAQYRQWLGVCTPQEIHGALLQATQNPQLAQWAARVLTPLAT